MNRLHVYLIGAAFLLLSNVYIFAQNIKINPQKTNLGFVPPGDEINVRVTVTNTSQTNILEITDIKTSCQCTIATIEKNKLRPGESTKMTLLIRTRQHSGELNSGIAITWSGDNGKTSETSLASVTAKVVSIAELIPNDIDLGTLHITDKSVGNIVEVNRGERDLGWTTFKIEHPKNILPITTSPYTDNGKWFIKTELDPSKASIGTFRQVFLFKFYKEADFINEVKQLAITAIVIGDIFAEPNSIYAGVLKAEAKNSQLYIKIRANTSQKLIPISTGVSDPGLLSVKYIAEDDGGLRYVLMIRPRKNLKDFDENLLITVKLESGKLETVSVPIVGFISP